MPISISDSFNSFAEKVHTTPFVNTMVNNPLFMSLLFTTIIVVIILGCYYRNDDAESWGGKAKLFVYVFITSLILFSLHFYSTRREYVDDQSTMSARNMVHTVSNEQFIGSKYPVSAYQGNNNIPDPFPQDITNAAASNYVGRGEEYKNNNRHSHMLTKSNAESNGESKSEPKDYQNNDIMGSIVQLGDMSISDVNV